MKRELFYSILKYRQGLVLGESLNAGILFFDPVSNQFTFKCGDLKRISRAYPEISVNFLNQFISTLTHNINRLSDTSFFQFDGDNLESFIRKELFYSDAAGLSFESVERVPISEIGDFQKTINYLKQIFLVGPNEFNQERKKRNEDYILAVVSNILKSKDPRIFDKIKRDETIVTPLIQITFDFFWQGKEVHLAKALAFDLENDLLIQNKALQIYGALEQLNRTYFKTSEAAKLDLLVSIPTNKEHFPEFDKALKIIESTNAPLNISLEKDWNRYTDEIVSNAEVLTHN